MKGEQTAMDAVSAWRILKRHPGYIADWWREAAGVPPPAGEPFPIRTQSEADLGAASWGLLAWEDPLSGDGPASPFWADLPMLEGVAGRKGTPPFAELVRSEGASPSGLRLTDGALVLRVERGHAAGQVWIEDGAAFDPAGGLALYLPYDLALRTQLARVEDLTSVAGPDAGDAPSPGLWRASCCSPSTASWQASPPV